MEMVEPSKSIAKKDQLNYSGILTQLVDNCLRNLGTLDHCYHVDALEEALYIDVKGLKLRERIDAFRIELKPAMAEFEAKLIKEAIATKVWRHNDCFDTIEKLPVPIRAKLRIRLMSAKHRTRMNFLFNLLSEYQATLEAKDSVQEGSK